MSLLCLVLFLVLPWCFWCFSWCFTGASGAYHGACLVLDWCFWCFGTKKVELWRDRMVRAVDYLWKEAGLGRAWDLFRWVQP